MTAERVLLAQDPDPAPVLDRPVIAALLEFEWLRSVEAEALTRVAVSVVFDWIPLDAWIDA